MKYTHTPLWLAMAFFSFFTPSASAKCYPGSSGSGGSAPSSGESHYIYRPQFMGAAPTINQSPNSVPLGARIGYMKERMLVNSTGRPVYTCTPMPTSLSQQLSPNFSPSPIRDIYGAYPSSIPGIGIQSVTINGYPFPGTVLGQQEITRRPEAIEVEMVFIRTGIVQSTGPFNGTFAYEIAEGTGDILYEYRFNNDLGTPLPVTPTCNLQPIPAVSLGTHPTSIFTGSNKVTPLKDFTLELTCTGGTQGTSLSATMTLTDNTNTANTTDALSLSTTDVRGVSVQILRNGIPLHLGPINGPNSHYLGTFSPQAGYSIPLQARYMQTGSSVSGGGEANAEATVTINYQ